MAELGVAAASMAEDKYNRKNPAVKRILQELKEMQSNPSDDFMSLPLEENIFEWQFAILGPRDSEFEGGIYHGRIQLPADYPFKPPSFMLLTTNGRFETQTKICLSISNHHPEHWQPSWSVRTALVALIAFMPTNPDGALGSLDYNKGERRALAIKSRDAAPRYGSPERQKLIDEIHQYMLSKAPPIPELPSAAPEGNESHVDENRNAQANHLTSGMAEAVHEVPDQDLILDGNPEVEQRITEEVGEVRVDAGTGRLRVNFPDGVRFNGRVPSVEPRGQSPGSVARVQRPVDDRLLTYAAVGLTVAIVVLILKKFLKSGGLAGFNTDGL